VDEPTVSDWISNPSDTAELYEERPYPGDGVVRHTMAKVLSIGLASRSMGRTGPKSILDIGCGTGEIACGVARAFPSARMVAIDVNPPSLRLARDLARREAPNLTVLQCDISTGLRSDLEQHSLMPDGGFDIVTSFGVLHHLPDPAIGFAEARDIVSDAGLFLCYVYSRLGRWTDVGIRLLLDEAGADDVERRLDLLRALDLGSGFTATSRLAFIKSIRNRMRFGPPLDVRAMIGAYRRRSAETHEADHWANPVEHMFSFGELADLLASTGWGFDGLAVGGGLPTSPEALTKDPALQSVLRDLPDAARYDFFAWRQKARGFTFFARPGEVVRAPGDAPGG
jgi:SAM-dependent methyltransferase